MAFRVLSFVMAVAFLAKAVLALTAPRRFYARRRQHYATETMPSRLWIPPAFVLSLTGAAWLATFLHYQSWGWLVTGSLSGLASLALHHLFCWKSHRQTMLRLVTSPKVKWLDSLLLAVGLAFLALSLFVY